VARAAGGSFRDALSTLDQIVAFGGSQVSTDDVVELLGAADAEILFDTTDALASGDARGALEAVERLARSGRDPGQFARDLIAHLRQLLVARATGEVPESFTVTVAQPQRLAEQAERIGEGRLMGAIDSLSSAVAAMREGDDPRLSLEVALLKVARPSLDASQDALLRRIETLEGRIGGSGVGESSTDALQGFKTSGEGSPTPPSPDQASEDEPPTEAHAETAEATPSAEAAAATAVAGADIERIVELWPAVIEHVRQSGSAMLSSLFEGARPLEVDAERGVLRIGFPASAKFNKRKAEAPANVERVADALKAIAGEPLRPAYELVEGEEAPASEALSAALGEEEMIELLKTKFDAREVELDERESEAG